MRYRLILPPLIVHCCHCRWCQRETGAPFALNALIESERLQLLTGDVDVVATPSASGKGQRIARCPSCRVALWSHYYGAGERLSFVRVGTLDDPEIAHPAMTIWTSSAPSWACFDEGLPQVERQPPPVA